MLVDTILRGYDVPKIYLRKTGTKPDTYDVVDGQQRLRAVWDFFDAKFTLDKNIDPVDGEKIAGLKYEELPDELRMRFDTYPLDIVILDNTDEEEVREMFLRLQNGTTLKAQERRNALLGDMRDFVYNLASHKIFSSVPFSNSRLAHHQVAAQLVCLGLANDPTNVRKAELDKMYGQNKIFTRTSKEAKNVVKILDTLLKIFPEKTPELRQFNIIALYCMVMEFERQYVFKNISNKFHAWFIEFEKDREAEDKKDEDEADPEWRTYKEKTSHATDSQDSIQWRVDFLSRNLLARFPWLSRKDNLRAFTNVQRITIFRRDKKICQIRLKCKGTKVSWDNWHCDHIVAWSQGGKTTVENGQTACIPCNTSKGSAS